MNFNIKNIAFIITLTGILCACGNTNEANQTAEQSTNEPTESVENTTIASCDILSEAMIRQAMAINDNLELESKEDVVYEQQYCEKSWDDGSVYGQVSLMVQLKPFETKAEAIEEFERGIKVLKGGVKQKAKDEKTGIKAEFKYKGDFEAVEGIGDAAVWQSKQSIVIHAMLQFVANNRIYTLNVDKQGATDAEMLEAAKMLAKAIL